MVGPRKPPRFPTELMNPTETAAAESPCMIVGRTQNDGAHAHSMNAVKQSHIIVNRNGCLGMVVRAKKNESL